jgi:hypothetical protein
MRRIRRLLLPIALLHVACASLSGQAAETFSRLKGCPRTGVTVTERRNFRMSELYASFCRRAFACPRTPPADVAADPERLEVWKANHDKQVVAYASSLVEGMTIYEVTGCGARATFACGSRGASVADCRDLDIGESKP